jgi:hypothetical protein
LLANITDVLTGIEEARAGNRKLYCPSGVESVLPLVHVANPGMKYRLRCPTKWPSSRK